MLLSFRDSRGVLEMINSVSNNVANASVQLSDGNKANVTVDKNVSDLALKGNSQQT